MGELLFYHPHDKSTEDKLTKEFIAIGKVAAAWASFENLIDMYIGLLCGMTMMESICVLSQYTNIQSRSRALIALLRAHKADEGKCKKLNVFFTNSVEKYLRIRNRLIHDPIGIDDNGVPWRAEFSANRKLESKVKTAPSKESNQLCRDIGDLMEKFGALWDEIVPTLPLTIQERLNQSFYPFDR